MLGTLEQIGWIRAVPNVDAPTRIEETVPYFQEVYGALGEQWSLRKPGELEQATMATAWLAARLRAALVDPGALPHEADAFRETKPLGSLQAAAIEAKRRGCSILAFVYDPTQPERGKLGWALNYFLQNRRTRDLMSGNFVTALVPLSAINAISEILAQQSMEESRWVVLDQQLRPVEQQVIYANPQEAERIVGELVVRYPAGPRQSE